MKIFPLKIWIFDFKNELIEDNPINNIDKFATFELEGVNEIIEPLNSYITSDGYVLVIVSPLVGPADYQFDVSRA